MLLAKKVIISEMGDHEYYKQSLSLADMEMFNNFSGLNSIHHEGDNLMGLWHDHNNVLGQENLPAFLIQDHSMTQSSDHDRKDKKRKAIVVVNTTPTTSAYSSPQVSDNASRKTNVSFFFLLILVYTSLTVYPVFTEQYYLFRISCNSFLKNLIL